MKKITFLFLISALLVTHSVLAQEEKGQLISDRPGFTDSPLAARPGKFRIEATAFGLTHNEHEQGQAFGNAFLNAGILKNTEFQLGFGGFIKRPGTDGNESGMGDGVIRLKYNILGNEGGDVGIGILPYVILPTGKKGIGNEKVSMGINFPLSYGINEKMSLGIMPMWFHEANEKSTGLHHDFELATVLGFKVLEELVLFVQALNKASTETGSGWQALYGAGSAYTLGSDWQFDLEVNSGVTGRDENLLVTTGLTYILN